MIGASQSPIKVLVLGSEGMLGSMVLNKLSRNPLLSVEGTRRSKDADSGIYLDVFEFLKNPSAYEAILDRCDYIVNCVGIIKPFCRDDDPAGCATALWVNSVFPSKLASTLAGKKQRVLQIATDCVFSGSVGFYNEGHLHDPTDVYGRTKSLGEVNSPNFLHIRSSIIGPEKNGKLSLLEWFLSQEPGGVVQGFQHHTWNGVTTLQYASLCEKIITSGSFEPLRLESPVHHFLPNESVSKYQLLSIFKRVYSHDVKIVRVNDGMKVYRTLSSRFKTLGTLFPDTEMELAINVLKDFCGS